MSGKGPLEGLKVVELSHIMAGPICGLMLADMGAEVIKIEKVPGGDDSRRMAPPRQGGESSAFMMLNRNKRSLALDLKSEEGRAVLKRIVAESDILIENFRRGTMEKLGLGYDNLKAINPGLIYCGLSGFGRSGPYADRAGFDLITQGMSGLMSITGEGPGRPPVKVAAPITDITAGILAAMGVLAAYIRRLQTNEGQVVDTSLFEAGITQTYWQSAIAFATGSAPEPLGSAHPLSAPYQAVRTADGHITIGAANQANWERLLGVIGAPELADDPRFKDNDGRMAHRDILIEALEARFREKTSAEWLALLEEAGFPAGPVLSITEMHADPQTLARDMVIELEHPRAGAMKTLGLPVKFSRTPGGSRRPAPVYGEHGREILAEHGYSPEEIEALFADGILRSD